MTKVFLLMIYFVIYPLTFQQKYDLFQSSIYLTQFGTRFQPHDPIELLYTSSSVSSLFRCSMLCNQNRQCRTFDYDQSSLVCRLFESEYSTGTILTNSSSFTSRIGAILYNTTATSQFYSVYNQTCDHCSTGSNRYLQCINNTCQCPLNTYWNGQKCLNQVYDGSNCSSTLSCRQDLNLTCYPQTNTCTTVCNTFGFQQPPALYGTIAGGPQSVISADFNKDGHWDLAITDYYASSISILLGIGNGSFQQPATVYGPGGNNPFWLVSEDFNKDGNLDLAMCNEGSNNIAIFLGYGSGSFQTVTTFASGGTLPSSIVAADFNNDNITNLAVANTGSDYITIFLGYGTGGFQTPGTSYAASSHPSFLVSGDFNSDGRIDLAVVCRVSNQLLIFLGFGNGSFQNNATYTTGSTPYSVRTADFNGDSKLDLAVANFYSNSVNIFIGTGTGEFIAASPATYATTGDNPIDIAIQDLNGDSKMDLAVCNQVGNTITVFLGNGNGTFGQGQNYTSMGQKLQSIIAQDFNKDGKYDLAVTNQDSNTLAILLTQCV
ncbi:unnamed protein product [Adineta steineri]|uniref:Apple domain-containing protein n=3 Tax=Adineta steineri TaxID=433720 RepID=A0A819PAH4_9BILA|nr:unnamed protein product [Adineta steineri]CAF4009763.1 unnamed protein product [Adineta steineri]